MAVEPTYEELKQKIRVLKKEAESSDRQIEDTYKELLLVCLSATES